MKFKYLIVAAAFTFFGNFSIAQDKRVTLPPNWYNLDLAKDGYFGISTEKAYSELLKGKSPKQKVIVAVIDGGTDIKHEDLKGVLWTNTKEIPGNGIDDDKNGYIDDVHGWNFIGSAKGSLAYDNLELVRILKKLEPKYKGAILSTRMDSTQREEFQLYQKALGEFGRRYNDADQTLALLHRVVKILDTVAVMTNKPIPSLEDVENYKAENEEQEAYKGFIRKQSRESRTFEQFVGEMRDAYEDYKVMLNYNLNPRYDQRTELVGDNYADSKERFYGNNDVAGPDAEHGTHVAGIIGAARENNLGINGVANNVSIMVVRVVPQGDERDKDVANGIRYAVDNGAKVINMSFGKGFKWDKKVVDEAVKYAEAKGVLLVHAAGNDNADNDRVDNFPNKYYETEEYLAYQKERNKPPMPFRPSGNPIQGPGPSRNQDFNRVRPAAQTDTTGNVRFKFAHASNWISVGASAYKDDENLKAGFSNFGKNNVDVFAPGFMINSAVPGSKYKENDGTSMAAPVVSGLSALILSYYPDLKPAQIREILIKSVTKVTRKVKYTTERGEVLRVPFSDLCVSGGIVNAYNALKLAATY